MAPLLDRENLDQLGKAATDAFHVAVGFGVLGFQKAQVRRREIRRTLENQFGAGSNDLHRLAEVARTQVRGLDARVQTVEPRIAAALDQVEARLPEPVGTFVHQARTIAEAARDEARRRWLTEPDAPATPSAEPAGPAAASADQTASPNA